MDLELPTTWGLDDPAYDASVTAAFQVSVAALERASDERERLAALRTLMEAVEAAWQEVEDPPCDWEEVEDEPEFWEVEACFDLLCEQVGVDPDEARHRIADGTAGLHMGTQDDLRRAVGAVLADAFVARVADGLVAGQEVVEPGLGTFEISHRRAFVGHNPRSGDRIEVAARRLPVWYASSELKGWLNQRGPMPSEPLAAAFCGLLGRDRCLRLDGLGLFLLSMRKAFSAAHPLTGVRLDVPEVLVPVLRVDSGLLRRMNPG